MLIDDVDGRDAFIDSVVQNVFLIAWVERFFAQRSVQSEEKIVQFRCRYQIPPFLLKGITR